MTGLSEIRIVFRWAQRSALRHSGLKRDRQRKSRKKDLHGVWTLHSANCGCLRDGPSVTPVGQGWIDCCPGETAELVVICARDAVRSSDAATANSYATRPGGCDAYLQMAPATRRLRTTAVQADSARGEL